MPTAAGSRRTQADRSTITRAALESATIDLLVESGWASVSAIEVCKRAGVSRGAFHHHYSSLAALFAGALRRLYSEMVPEAASPDGPPPVTNLLKLIDRTWAALSEPRFKAVLEAWLAMSNDPQLRGQIGPVVGEFAKVFGPEQLPASGFAKRSEQTRYLMARETLLGLALGRAIAGGRALPHEGAVIAALKKAVAS
ncbi:MAG TPA: TetR/AcrR family transcriptional regulator [Mycobacteriales bacterium]|nr:TetR/AcrR family transcriptional regulator [Mycobacteriales bacterium]